ncbi:MAG: hypothetical protein MJ237_06400 [bacterium]|nr:hypothetical protein [bacterium]
METYDIAKKLEHFNNNGLYKEELKLARKEFVNGNKHPCIWCFLTDACCTIKKYKKRGKILANKALEVINTELEKDKDNAEYYYERGCTKSWLDDWQGELQDQLKAIELDSNNAKYYYRAGIAYRGLKKYSKAIMNFNIAIKLDSKCTEAYYEIATIIFAEEPTYFDNKQKKAMNILLNALKVCERNKDNLFTGLSFMYFSQNDYIKALKYANEAILFNKENGTGYYRKYCTLTALGKQDEAREYLEKANKFGYDECF